MSNTQNELIGPAQARIEEALTACIASFDCPVRLKEAMAYSLKAGGKRLRPLLALAAGEMAGLTEVQVMPMACALEMIHTYSLIHDDLPAMDNDDLRRGRPTSHKVFGEAMAILAGDALLNEAMLLLISSYGGTAQGALAAAMVARQSGKDGMIGGQVLDMEGETQRAALADLETMHRLKTGALIEAALSAPLVLAGKSKKDLDKVLTLGRDIGILFQIQDDILDVESDSLTMGKTVGKDARDHKSTYVTILGLDEAKRRMHALKERVSRSLLAVGSPPMLDALLEAIFDRNH